MSKDFLSRKMSRRDLLRKGGLFLGGALGTAYLGSRFLQPTQVVEAAPSLLDPRRIQALDLPANRLLVGTDGWAYLPNPSPGFYHPDDLAPAGLNTYMFGFTEAPVNATLTQLRALKGKARTSAPVLWLDQEQTFVIELFNAGLVMRPDLVDSHTVHFHGFRNAIPMFDGEPVSTVSVPIERRLKYVYIPHDPGTYMYHCHFEDTEHVHMGMVGAAIIRPEQNNGAGSIPAGKYVYNDGVLPGDPASTAYDREYVVFLSEVWSFAHWADSHIQLPEWSDYNPDFYLMNGRVYPDTLLPESAPTSTDGLGALTYQPYTSLIEANAGERILLRIMNLGFDVVSLALPGIKMKVVGKDATLLRGRYGENLFFERSILPIGPGESIDAIFTAPDVTSGSKTFMLHNRNYDTLTNNGGGVGGQMTEVRVYPAGTLPPQPLPTA